jgi:hypothetical protein
MSHLLYFTDLDNIKIRVRKGARETREVQGGEDFEQRSVVDAYVSSTEGKPTQKFEVDFARTFRTSS